MRNWNGRHCALSIDPRASENPNGSLFIVAPVFDCGKSKYDSCLSDGTHGHGKSKYFPGGLFLRKMNFNGFYFEGSFRRGKTNIDFSGNDLFSGLRNVGVGYDDSTSAFAGHVRIGKLKRLDRNNLLHVCGIYSHTHTNGMDTISTGEKYSFDVYSGTFQPGYRLTTAVSPISKIYTGFARQYQFNGSTSATYKDHHARSRHQRFDGHFGTRPANSSAQNESLGTRHQLDGANRPAKRYHCFGGRKKGFLTHETFFRDGADCRQPVFDGFCRAD